MKLSSSSFKSIYFLKSIGISNFKRLSFPFKLSYAVTYRCNLRCGMCNIWKKPPSAAELSLKDVETFFKTSNKFSWVGITGGEAFLRPDLPEITDIVVKYCRSLDAIHFATNAQLKDKIFAIIDRIRLRDNKIKIVFSLSIDGPQELHDKIRGVEGAWQKAVDTFIALKKIKSAKAQINFTISSFNIGRFEDTYLSLKSAYPELRFDDITINIFQKSSFYYDNQDMPAMDPDKLRAEILRIQKADNDSFSINNFLRRRYLNLYTKYLKTEKCPLKCQALSSTCFLDPAGDLFPCAVYNKRLLNIRDTREGLETAWNSDYAESLSYECSHDACPGCWSPCDAYSAIAGSLFKS